MSGDKPAVILAEAAEVISEARNDAISGEVAHEVAREVTERAAEQVDAAMDIAAQIAAGAQLTELGRMIAETETRINARMDALESRFSTWQSETFARLTEDLAPLVSAMEVILTELETEKSTQQQSETELDPKDQPEPPERASSPGTEPEEKSEVPTKPAKRRHFL